MTVRDSIVVFKTFDSRVGGKLVMIDELTPENLAELLREFADVEINTVAEDEFQNIKEDTEVIIAMPPQSTSRYIRLEAGVQKINIIGIGEYRGDEITVKNGIGLSKLLKAIERLPGVEFINPQGIAAKFIAGPATVIQVKNINLKGC